MAILSYKVTSGIAESRFIHVKITHYKQKIVPFRPIHNIAQNLSRFQHLPNNHRKISANLLNCFNDIKVFCKGVLFIAIHRRNIVTCLSIIRNSDIHFKTIEKITLKGLCRKVVFSASRPNILSRTETRRTLTLLIIPVPLN